MYQKFGDGGQVINNQYASPNISAGISRCRLMPLKEIEDDKGNLTIVEGNEHVPFKINRIFYLYGIPQDVVRGGHAHKRLHQFVIAAMGSFDVTLNDGLERKKFHLDRPDRGLYIPPMIWDELDNFSPGSLCLVLASDHYYEEDYIRDYGAFIKTRLGAIPPF